MYTLSPLYNFVLKNLIWEILAGRAPGAPASKSALEHIVIGPWNFNEIW